MTGGLAMLRSRVGFARAYTLVRCLSSHLVDSVAGSQLEDVINDVAEKSSSRGSQRSLQGRYEALVANGTLRPDVHQAACIQRLDRLCSDLQMYKKSASLYQQELAAYKRARQEMWQEVFDQEDQRLDLEQQQSSAVDQSVTKHSSSLRSMIGLGDRSAGQENLQDGDSPKQGQLNPEQRHRIVSARAERRLDELLGPAPLPPPAPKGVYIHGSVGSGKSLLMDLLYTTVAQPHPSLAAETLPHHRRLHFNSALLELHSRLHELDRHREEEERKKMEAYAQQAQQQAKAQHGGVLQTAWQQIRDPIAEKLKRSKLAKLAYRRMMRDRARRTVEEHSQALAQSNAVILRNAARALIRNCDTLALMQQSTRGSGPQEGEEEVEIDEGQPDAGHIAALLCFDEMQVNDVFNAVALKGLMEALLDEGCVVVATSNRAPWDLSRQGLHEDLFNHFIDHILTSCDVFQLDAEQDYRRLLGGPELIPPPSTSASMGISGEISRKCAQKFSYFYPLGRHSQEQLQREWESTSSNASPADSAAPADASGAGALKVMFGRSLEVRKRRGGAAWFEFEELCGRPLGAADYIAISQEFHTVFVEGVPAMSMKLRDRARRFITLVDELYNHRVRLVCSAEVPPDELFTGAADNDDPIIDLESLQFETAVEGSKLRRNLMVDGGVAPVANTPQAAAAAANYLGGAEERFAFARAVSRLYEMQAPPYLHSRPRQ